MTEWHASGYGAKQPNSNALDSFSNYGAAQGTSFSGTLASFIF
jgi:hypothetical protein